MPISVHRKSVRICHQAPGWSNQPTQAIDRHLEAHARALGWEPHQGIHVRYELVGFVGGGEFGLQFSLPDDVQQVRGADGVYIPG